jgi:Zn-dependent M28 family amino/carboxypeptidase
MSRVSRFGLPLTCAVVAACAPLDDAPPSLSADRLLHDIAVLSDDSMLGRAPGTVGEDRTVAYLTSQFAAAGLEPGNPDGSWTQTVDMVGITGTATLTTRIGRTSRALTPSTDFVAVTRRTVPTVDVAASDLVFVGYGVTAPEYDWDDFKDVDVHGKTLIVLVNDPAVPDPADTTRLDAATFRGEAMTYYGRWTYKYEEATRRGAAAVLIVHEDGPAGYPWEVVRDGWGQGRERMDTRSADNNASRVAVEGWITTATARQLLADAGQDFDVLKATARRRDFRPVALGGTATIHLRNTIRDIRSRNVVARLPGRDSSVADEVVIYTGHWDHLGVGPSTTGDTIWNGARDNASGTAGLLELARAFHTAGAPRRSVIFLAVTAEENGLLGSKWYAEHPLYPLTKTLADINIDVLNAWGPTEDLVVIGMGNSTLDDVLQQVAATAGRRLVPDQEPSKGFFYRSDHFEFAKQGVPALYVEEGNQYIGQPDSFGETKRAAWDADLYHKPADQVDPAWNLAGAVADLELLYQVGRRVANGDVWPAWKDGTEFKATREAMLATP